MYMHDQRQSFSPLAIVSPWEQLHIQPVLHPRLEPRVIKYLIRMQRVAVELCKNGVRMTQLKFPPAQIWVCHFYCSEPSCRSCFKPSLAHT